MTLLPRNAALLVIDVQQGFDDRRWGASSTPEAVGNIARLLAAWRAAGLPIYHVHHDSQAPNGAFRAGTPGNAPQPEAAPLPGEPVYRKTVNSAFIGTTLERDLRNAGITTVVIVGITTNHCVSTTTRMAGNLWFDTYIVSDATAAFAQTAIDGRRRSAIDVHVGALSDLQHEFATVVDTASLLDPRD